MSRLREPNLGPLIGHTTASSARIWIRGGDLGEDGAGGDRHRRTLGVIAITAVGNRPVDDPKVHYFRLRREYDRTGTFTLGEEGCVTGAHGPEPLKPGTRYEARVGTLTVDVPSPDDESLDSAELSSRLPAAGAWLDDLMRLDEKRSLATFTTFPENAVDSMSFVLGSCRYPGILWQERNSDAIFGAIHDEVRGRDGRKPASFVLMAGDQIYADTLNRHVPIGRAESYAEFQERYLTAFGSRNMRRLLRSVPHYMILDDHEIEDNWSQDRVKRERERQLFMNAITAYRSYQWVHGPSCFGERLYYNFDFGDYPFFVIDTRTQRFMDDVPDSLDDNHMLGRPGLDPEEPGQLDLLLAWLEGAQETRGDVPKFIVTSSVFAPNPIAAREGRRHDDTARRVKWKEDSDSWPAFPNTRKAILETIVRNRIQNVVFLSGDIHCSNVCQFEFSGSMEVAGLMGGAVTSSAFYWPFPFADGEPSNFVHDSKAEGQEDTFDIDGTHKLDYKAWNFTQDNNFCRVDVDKANHKITIRPFDADGEPVERGGWFGMGGKPIVSELDLAPW